ncbi:MAG: nitroreductase family protein [Bacteroidales bacterium]|nr:nitroreductase family protein [Bacteroidales bacterium]
MEFLQLAKERYSCRMLTDLPVEQEKIDKILQCANYAPTGVNKQPFKLWLMQSDEAVANIKKTTTYTFGAKLFLVVGGNPAEAWVRSFDGRNIADVDASIVATHIMLAIHDLGLASTWVGKFDAPMLQTIYPEMKDYDLIAIFPIGYPADNAQPGPRHATRKAIEDIVVIK